MILVNSGFLRAKQFLRKLSAIWTSALKNLRQPCPRPKNLKNISFRVCQIISLPGAPTSLGPDLTAALQTPVTLPPDIAPSHPQYLQPQQEYSLNLRDPKNNITKRKGMTYSQTKGEIKRTVDR
jgi:hypothetical protein